MKKNVYIKSVLRQPVLSLILAFLLFIATFGFVLRSIEFITVRQQIYTISEYFQSVGFLLGDTAFADVNVGADFLEDNPYIEMIDRRRVVEGMMPDMLNSAVNDPMGWVSRTRRGEFPDAETLAERHDVFFYAVLMDKVEQGVGRGRLTLAVDEVLVGYPEHLMAGEQELQMSFSLGRDIEFNLDDLEIGERYFFRAMFANLAGGATLTIEAHFSMQPLYPDGLWYIQVPEGETIDLADPEFAGIRKEVEILRHSHHAVQLRTTREMSLLLPTMLGDGVGFMVEGRPIDMEDYLNANPVAVIHNQLARIRGLNVGDTITVEVPQQHTAEHFNTDFFSFLVFAGGVTRDFAFAHESLVDIRVENDLHAESIQEIELEIVGIYNLFRQFGGDPATNFSSNIYIPDSVLSEDVIISSQRWRSPDDENFLPSFWYTFRLTNSRDELTFVAQNRQPLGELGFTLVMMDGAAGAQNFWQSANLVIQSLTFNAVVFSIVLLLILTLVVFLFLRQRYKDLAISRMLGYSAWKSVGGIWLTAILSLISITLGSIVAWLFAQRTITDTLVVFEELIEGYGSAFTLSPFWLIGLIIFVFILVLLMVLIGAIRLAHRPLLELLQGKG